MPESGSFLKSPILVKSQSERRKSFTALPFRAKSYRTKLLAGS
jgi:hypothetical protein